MARRPVSPHLIVGKCVRLPLAEATWHGPDLGRPIAAPLERCAELLGVDLATVHEAAAKVEPYTRADGIKVWSLMQLERNHPDHRAAGEATMGAIFPDARNPFAHPELLEEEGLKPWEVGEVWLIASPSPNHYVDVTDLFDRKLAALQAHKSQTAHRDRLAVRRLDATCTTKDQSRPLPS